MKTYATGWQRWKKWSQQKLGFSEIPANPLHISLYLQDLLNDAKENLSHAGLLGADELFSVRDKDINIEEHKMIIFIPKRKNDLYREVHFSDIYKSGKVTCPVSITEKLMYLLPDEKDSPFPVTRRIINKTKDKEFHRSKGISNSTLKARIQNALEPIR